MKKIAVIGANGQLGSDICSVSGNTYEVIPLTHAQIEVADIDNAKEVLSKVKPDLLINTAAYHNVPKCESDPLLAFKINGLGSLNLAKLSSEIGFKLVHFSTDYVFDGQKNKPYLEEDKPNPLNIYAATKLSGENFIQNYCEKYFVIRISGIYGKVPCRAKGDNFVSNMIKFSKEKPEVRVVDDEVLTPTPTYHIALNIIELMETENFGLYHMTCEGECSWYEFAKTIFETINIKTPLYNASVKDFPSNVKRPFYSVLENSKLKEIKLNRMPHWQNGLREFLKTNYL